MIANNHSRKGNDNALSHQSPFNTEEIQAFCVKAIPKLEALVRSQREAASNAHSSAAEIRHNELAKALEAAIEFIDRLKVAHLVKSIR